MKKLLFAAVLLCAPLTMTACATTPTAHLQAGKADAVAWNSLKGAALVLDGLAKSGQLHGASAARASEGLKKARTLLLTADAAYRAGNTGSYEQNVAAASAILAELLTIAAQAQKGA